MTEDLRKAAEAAEKVAPSPWEVDRELMRDAPSHHHEFIVFDGKGRHILDTSNSDANFGEICEEYGDDESGGDAWNEPARVVTSFVALANPAAILALYAERDAAIARAEKAEREREELRRTAANLCTHWDAATASLAVVTAERDKLSSQAHFLLDLLLSHAPKRITEHEEVVKVRLAIHGPEALKEPTNAE
jgi:hypothetical protein